MKKILILVSSLFLSCCMFAQNADIQKGIEYHNKAHTGDLSNAQKCIDTLKPYIDSDAVACAYYGSALTLLAAYAIENNNPIKSLEYLEEGGKFLDKAVKLDPKNIIVRIIRLENGIEVSRTSPIKRYAVIKDDVDFLQEDSVIMSVGVEIQAEIFADCGLYLLDSGDLDGALDLFDMAVEVGGSSEWAKLAQQMIDKYSE